jgi:amino acid transporter
LAGGVVTILVALCYGELAVRSSTAGAEFLYTLHTFGRLPAFLVGWFLTLSAVAMCAFEGIALAWFARTLVPQIALSDAYVVAGTPVTWDALAIGITTALIIAVLHLRGARSAIRFQNVVTYTFIAVIAVLIICGVSLGSVRNLHPLIATSPGQSAAIGVMWIFATCAYFLNGWQASLHAIEERREDVSVRAAVFSMIAAVGAATMFYIGIIIASSMAVSWPTLLTRELPAAAAFAALGGGGILGKVVLVAAMVSLTKTWSATAWIATRLLYAQSRHGLLPQQLGTVDPVRHAPRSAVVVVTILSMVGLALGRSAVLPIVDTLSICGAAIIILSILVLLRRRQIDPRPSAYSVPGGMVTIWAAFVGTCAMVGIAFFKPLLDAHGAIPMEWILIVSWGILGTITWISTGRLRRGRHPEGISVKLEAGKSGSLDEWDHKVR